MSKLLAQHGTAKGQKINEGLNEGSLSGAIFSINEEIVESIEKYMQTSENLNDDNSYLDPQFYYSTYDTSMHKKISEIDSFPNSVTRRDWRNRDDKILNYITCHAESTKKISNTLIAPGFYIDNIDWHFDYSVEIYNYCVEAFEFENYALSLLIHSSFFNNKKNVQEMIEELGDICERKDYIYFTICYDMSTDNNYEDIDYNCLSNILSFIYQLKNQGFKFIIGYGFMNSILFAMMGCEYIASGWFNTLRKFQKNKFEPVKVFGRRKKRYTSIPLLSYLMFDDINSMVNSEKIKKEDLVSGTRYDGIFIQAENTLSFVDLEQQYWESLKNIFNLLSQMGDLIKKIDYIENLIVNAQALYQKVCEELENKEEQESLKRIKSASKHLESWKLAIDLFKQNEMIL